MKILVLGAGGVGGYFGAQLLRCGADVSFLVRDTRKARIDAEGLRVETPRETFVVRPATVTAAEAGPRYDLIVLAPKAYDLADAMASLHTALGGGAVLLPLLNGLDHLDALDGRVGRARVMGGAAHIAATVTPEGAVRQLSDLHILTVGPRDPAHADLAARFVALCRQAPFDTIHADDIEQVLWDKWTFLATLAGMTTLCRGSVGRIVATPDGADLMRRMYAECCAVAERHGHPVGEAARARALAMLTESGSGFTASMLRDLEAGNRTEHDHVLGAMARRGAAMGIDTVLVRLAYTQLAVQAAG